MDCFNIASTKLSLPEKQVNQTWRFAVADPQWAIQDKAISNLGHNYLLKDERKARASEPGDLDSIQGAIESGLFQHGVY